MRANGNGTVATFWRTIAIGIAAVLIAVIPIAYTLASGGIRRDMNRVETNVDNNSTAITMLQIQHAQVLTKLDIFLDNNKAKQP